MVDWLVPTCPLMFPSVQVTAALPRTAKLAAADEVVDAALPLLRSSSTEDRDAVDGEDPPHAKERAAASETKRANRALRGAIECSR